MAHKLFTLAEANRTLPLVKRIVEDVLSVYPDWKDLVDRYGLIAAQARPEWGESQEQLSLKAEIDAVAGKINGYLGELERIGCEFKGFDERGGAVPTKLPRVVRTHGEAMRIMMAEQTERVLADWPKDAPRLVYVRAVAEREATFAVDRIQDYVEMGYQATKKALG